MDIMERITVGTINDYINVFYGKDREVWVRGGGPGPEYEDCSLYDFIRRIAKAHGVDAAPNNEDLDWQMCDMLADGAETKEGLIALLYAAAVQATEMRERLHEIEEILCGNEAGFDLDRLRELVEADKDGRIKILPVAWDRTCGSCANFRRTPGMCSGICSVRSLNRNRRGTELTNAGTFTPYQSRRACKRYAPAKESAEAELDRKEQQDANAAAHRYKAEADRRAQDQQRLEGRVKTLTEALNASKQEAHASAARVKELEARPIEVKGADPDDIARWRAEGAKPVQAQLDKVQAEADDLREKLREAEAGKDSTADELAISKQIVNTVEGILRARFEALDAMPYEVFETAVEPFEALRDRLSEALEVGRWPL